MPYLLAKKEGKTYLIKIDNLTVARGEELSEQYDVICYDKCARYLMDLLGCHYTEQYWEEHFHKGAAILDVTRMLRF